MTVQNSSTSLADEFKNLITDITTEISKQSVLQEVKRSEETIKQAGAKLPGIAERLQFSVQKLEDFLRQNADQFADVHKRIDAVDEKLMHAHQKLSDEAVAAHKETIRLSQEQHIFMKSYVRDIGDTNRLFLQEKLLEFTNLFSQEQYRQHKFRKTLYWLVGMELLVTIGAAVALYLKK
ncbi:hypothetical protein SAMN04487897_12539 [Paenibacillus sp. yr247]|uniref:hypothetical protein n=1 Tax=Paenibacillus sp. yr247 TaxID=1761880 RepID=UPI000881F05B|nr:hypothetical protein [Paenibacillus sp. yr247]SDO87683.1 hypothetical protein SAMN04487897_12539 [Paenibacillus sp. yr247]